MDWFERLTGFREGKYEEVPGKLEVDGQELHSRVSGYRYAIGDFEVASLKSLRERVQRVDGLPGSLTVRNVTGDMRAMHMEAEYAGALFQVTSQFNMLEMVSPDVTPEDGVTRYQYDRTHGPACAIAAGAGTIYRNCFVPVAYGHGQTRYRQLDGLADVGHVLAQAIGLPTRALWAMRNGYAMCSREGLVAITAHLAALNDDEADALRVCCGSACIAMSK